MQGRSGVQTVRGYNKTGKLPCGQTVKTWTSLNRCTNCASNIKFLPKRNFI